jgi:serine protein kinase
MTLPGRELLDRLARSNPLPDFVRNHWSGSFADYLDIVRATPRVTRNAHQRLYDMILSHGTDEIVVHKEKLTRYRFFDDPIGGGHDAVFGLERTLASLVQILESAARGYGTERRVLLLHGPVGSSKSTIVRLLKRGLEAYSRTEEGALYTFSWKENQPDGSVALVPCPMHEEPLRLIPAEVRPAFLNAINAGLSDSSYQVQVNGDLDPFCRYQFQQRLAKYNGDWGRVLEDVVVRRLVLSAGTIRFFPTSRLTQFNPPTETINEQKYENE